MVHDGQRGRRRARALIGLAIGFGLATVYIVVTAPGWFEPMYMSLWAIALPVMAVASYSIGLGWMVRIYRARTEPGERTWRYRDTEDTTRGPALKTTDGQRGRRIARGLIVLAIVYGLVAVFVYVAQPWFMDPMSGVPQEWSPLPIFGIASYFIGFGLMVRIYRAQPEPGQRSWRYRDY
jgi:drug/metabolite transporter (DMT)-like permease